MRTILFHRLACYVITMMALASAVAKEPIWTHDEYPLKHLIDQEDRAPVRILPANAEQPTISPLALDNIARYWLELISDYQLPGAAIGIVQSDGLIYEVCAGKRNVREEAEINGDTLFNLGEATLAFTSLLAATTDRPDNPIFDRRAVTVSPLFRMTEPQAQQKCRIRDLLAMTAGAPSYSDKILDPQWAQPEDVFALLGQAPVMSQPDEHFRRSKTSATVGGYLVAMAIGNQKRGLYSNYIDVVTEKLFLPLGLERATFSPKKAKESGNYASGHTPADFSYNPAYAEEPERNPLAPFNGLKISLHDAARWLQTELSQGVAPNGERIASPISVRERWQPAQVQNSDHRGLGWTRRYHLETEIIMAQSQYGDQSAAIGIFPAYRTGFIVFTNAGDEDAERLLQAVSLGMAEVLKDSRQSAKTPAIASEATAQ
ncbi:serine hydrolase domain-containing protein [Cerasicoccus frondis]|uniref:serine hydrolase domain-containing protein n=1 Tax=Cerasicoccus frondis TaxID=490090 RepID=UPI0028529DF6|nr:serine hydrolase domain-containing protein [Cerasicoccus frondis]